MMLDYTIVGAGLFGSVFAHEAAKAGKKVAVIDKREHIGGNCYTEFISGINVHKYGPHIFHTNDKEIWDYVNQFAEFNNFVNRPKVMNGELYSFPINLMTLYQLWGVTTPDEAKVVLEMKKVKIKDPKNLKEWILSQVGYEIYHKFIEGYTTKQWGRDPAELPASIIKRLPIRFTFDDNYFTDRYQGIPIGGYTQIFEKLLSGIPKVTGVDFFESREEIEKESKKIVFTGKIDEFFDYNLGELEYRSLRFESELHEGDYQGNAVVNYTNANVPFTRICEHKHFQFGQQENTIITKEYPDSYDKTKIPFYPVCDEKNNEMYRAYREQAKLLPNYIFGGRLAEYKYFDMHQIIASALSKWKKEFTGEQNGD